MQINVQLQFQGVHGNKTYMMPALWVEEQLTLTDKQAKDFKDSVSVGCGAVTSQGAHVAVVFR